MGTLRGQRLCWQAWAVGGAIFTMPTARASGILTMGDANKGIAAVSAARSWRHMGACAAHSEKEDPTTDTVLGSASLTIT